MGVTTQAPAAGTTTTPQIAVIGTQDEQGAAVTGQYTQEELAALQAGAGGGLGVGGPEASLTEDPTARGKVRKKVLGTKQLQIPLTSSGISTGATVASGLNI